MGRGLDSVEGMLLPESLALCKMLRPRIILLEQVSAIGSHEHLKFIFREAHWAGYIVKFAKIINIKAISPVTRNRWLAILVRAEDTKVQPLPVQMWDILDNLSPESVDAVGGFPFEHHVQLVIDDETKKLASTPAMVPGTNRVCTPKQAFESRLDSIKHPVNTFVASYGSQHRLNPDHLAKKGIFCHFLALQGKEPRFWHPIEICLLHGFTGTMVLPNDLKVAWHFVGNFICPGHAILLIVNAANWMPERVNTIDIKEAFRTFNQKRQTAAGMHPQMSRHGTFYGSQGSSFDLDSLTDDFLANLIGTLMPFGFFWDQSGWHSILTLQAVDLPMSIVTTLQDEDEEPVEDAAIPSTVVPHLCSKDAANMKTDHFISGLLLTHRSISCYPFGISTIGLIMRLSVLMGCRWY